MSDGAVLERVVSGRFEAINLLLERLEAELSREVVADCHLVAVGERKSGSGHERCGDGGAEKSPAQSAGHEIVLLPFLGATHLVRCVDKYAGFSL